ncbi:hypothetical protein KEM48_005962 [Puccinia striiformis f. sp. tritici PST-130]|uniref:Uncharacterized protein n=2 Tax=Puccinia striiformis TaxID=27350 RepID=A0A0L0VDH2_9BASI|nr:hypothetical protein H4Q26_006347 [Puccinia striiformis f. sp. tritici PST-130]KAI9614497.1 hypothetical protein KEM48_005962 [Puccinia striiformis f. sp. tritici PST-130]KNE97328.1 hypothetical protein PSTG_09439 [Puccinia striiformis f. sp. tritici PST-78]POW15549.1 hypothetical protein PSTT_02119 [Puccinia striiformis]
MVWITFMYLTKVASRLADEKPKPLLVGIGGDPQPTPEVRWTHAHWLLTAPDNLPQVPRFASKWEMLPTRASPPAPSPLRGFTRAPKDWL